MQMENFKLISDEEYKVLKIQAATNIRYLLEIGQLSQTELAKILGVAPNTISSYLNDVNDMKLTFLLNITRLFGCSIDEFLFTDFRERNYQPMYFEKVKKYFGLYTLYYFNTVDDEDSEKCSRIQYGLLYVYKPKDIFDNHVKVIAAFGLTFDELKINYEKYSSSCNYEKMEELADTSENVLIYKGNLEIIEQAINVHLMHNSKDSAFYTLQKPKGTREYIGGLGLITSISRGKDVFGCSQYMACCKGLVKMHEAELVKFLFIERKGEYLSRYDLEKVLKRISQYYDSSQNELDEEEKKILVKHNLNRVIENCMMKYSKRYIRVDPDLEYAWYQKCKTYVLKRQGV